MKKTISIILSCILSLNMQSLIVRAESLDMPEEQKEAYYSVITQAEQQYGEYTLMNLNNIQYARGVCYIEIRDVNKDGTYELLLVHNNGETNEFDFPKTESYQYELWTYFNGQASLLETDGVHYSNGGFPSICWTEYEENTYLVTNYQNVESCWLHGFKDDGSFGVTDIFLCEFNGNDFTYSANGTEVDSDEWIQICQAYLENAEYVDLFYQDGDHIKDKLDKTKNYLSGLPSGEEYSSDAGKTGNNSFLTGNDQYDEIIRDYYRGISSDWSIQEFCENGLCYLPGYEKDVNRIGYCLLDVDNNGVEELLIGQSGNDGSVGILYALYTMEGDERILIASSGELRSYYLCTDNTIAYECFSGPSNCYWSYYNLNGAQLEAKETVLFDSEYDEENPWFYSNTDAWEEDLEPITEDYADAVRNAYEYKKISLISLAEIAAEIDGDYDEY